MLHGKKIVLGITGSIAAYKSALLVRLLIKAGAEVRVVMTRGAAQFITPLSLSVLSGRPVVTDLVSDTDTWNNHVELGLWGDIFLIAPVSANTLAKMAHGECDNLLLATYLSARCPVWLAPAMDEDMWHHSSTQENISTLQQRGHYVIPVGHGSLASGLVGEGRMAEPESILEELSEYFTEVSDKLKGKKILITAGPTHEPIDPVRYIGNNSSGKMGIALAEAATRAGAEVTLVLGPVNNIPIPSAIQVRRVHTASEMYDACTALFPSVDIAILAAAVADYTPAHPSDSKIKKKEDALSLDLVKTKDILAALGAAKKPAQVLVGFALETDNEKTNAMEKLHAKNCDMLVLNSLRDEGAGFMYDTNKVTLLHRDGTEQTYELKSKKQVSNDILTQLAKYL